MRRQRGRRRVHDPRRAEVDLPNTLRNRHRRWKCGNSISTPTHNVYSSKQCSRILSFCFFSSHIIITSTAIWSARAILPNLLGWVSRVESRNTILFGLNKAIWFFQDNWFRFLFVGVEESEGFSSIAQRVIMIMYNLFKKRNVVLYDGILQVQYELDYSRVRTPSLLTAGRWEKQPRGSRSQWVQGKGRHSCMEPLPRRLSSKRVK